MGAGDQNNQGIHAPLAGWHGELPMTRQMDTFNYIIGAMPLVNPWWLLVSENAPSILEGNPHRWVGWTVTVQEYDDETGDALPGEYEITHDKIMQALQHVLEHHDDFNVAVWLNSLNLRNGHLDDVDFDSDTADQILQLVCFGEVKYG